MRLKVAMRTSLNTLHESLDINAIITESFVANSPPLGENAKKIKPFHLLHLHSLFLTNLKIGVSEYSS